MKTSIIGSLRFRLSWTHGIVISLAIACVGLCHYYFISSRSQRDFDAHLLIDARLFVSHLSASPGVSQLLTNELPPEDILTLEEFLPYFVITNPQGEVISSNLYSKFMQEMLQLGEFKVLLKQNSGFTSVTAPDGTIFRFANLPKTDPANSSGYIVHLGRNTEQVQATLNEAWVIGAYSVPLVLALSVSVGWFLAGRALKPFAEVAETAEQLTSENLNTQIVTSYKEREVQRLVESFNSMMWRLNRSFQQVRQFNADAAHELRTPLAILQGENEIALRNPSLPDDVRAVLASNLEELDRLTRVVNDLLTLAEAESGTEILKRTPIQVSAILKDLIEEMTPLAEDRLLKIECLGLPDLRVLGDDLWIRRALLNLIDNSIKYSKPGGIIEVWLKRIDSTVQIGIRDFGIGIDPKDLPRIFDRLYRADPARSRTKGGSGLGLSIVKWIVEAHHGQIKVHSLPDRGTTVEIMLPAVDA